MSKSRSRVPMIRGKEICTWKCLHARPKLEAAGPLVLESACGGLLVTYPLVEAPVNFRHNLQDSKRSR